MSDNMNGKLTEVKPWTSKVQFIKRQIQMHTHIHYTYKQKNPHG